MEDLSFGIFVVIIVILVIMLIRWRLNWGQSFRDKQTQQMIDLATKRAAYEQQQKENEKKKEKANTIFVSPKGEAQKGSFENKDFNR